MITPWIQIGLRVAQDPAAKIVCPQCNQAELTIFDQTLQANHTEEPRTERHVLCPACGASQSIRL